MVSPIWLIIIAIVFAVAGYVVGTSDGAANAEGDGSRLPDSQDLVPLAPSSPLAEVIAATKAATFARAAQAVALYPKRIDRRGELVQHLVALADAPDLSAPIEDDADASVDNPEPAQFTAGGDTDR